MEKRKWISVWVNVRLILMVIAVIGLYSFTGNRNEARNLKKSVVVFKGGQDLFLTEAMVNKLFIENYVVVKSTAKETLDLNKLERLLDNNKMVEKSEVFVTVDGVLKTIVTQKTPVARVETDDLSFYIDYRGSVMPISENYTARVPLISGEASETNLSYMKGVLKMIYDDPFLRKNIIGIKILPTRGLVMKNRNFDYDIDFGRTINSEEKFKNYKAFFQKAVKDSVLLRYKKINLKFSQQVVCTK